MPRLTAKNYLRAHGRLRKLWLQNARLFAELTPTEQWQLHDFFKPDKDWSDQELLKYRETITALRPSLPHQAGRALERFWTLSAQFAMKRVNAAKQPAGGDRITRQEDRKFTIKAVARPEADAQRLARAFISLAIARAKKRDADRADQADDDIAGRSLP